MIKPKLITDQAYIQRFHKGVAEKFELHPKQKELAKALASGYHIKVDCGRKFGKTVTAKYLSLRTAALYTDAPIYIVAPKLKQAREIYHVKREIERICPPGYIKRVYEQDMRYVFHSGSFIKIDGSDNPEIHRGPDMFLVIVDELKDCHPAMMEAIEPNILTVGGLIALLGTPPDNEEEPSAKVYWDYTKTSKTDPGWKYFQYASIDNPHNPKKVLENIKARLIANGDADIWYREYEGVYVHGGKRFIFPFFDKPDAGGSKNVFPDQELMQEALKAIEEGAEAYSIADPGTAKAFAQLFIVYKRATGEIWLLREIYETSQGENSVRPLAKRELEIMEEFGLSPWSWSLYYDEAARWFQKERQDMGTDYGWTPTNKFYMKAEPGETKPHISLLKDVIRLGKLKVSDACTNTISEIRGYAKTKGGLIMKKRDHAIDCLRYFLDVSNYQVDGTPGAIAPTAHNMVKAEIKIEKSLDSFINPDDLETTIEKIFSEYLEDY